MTTQDRATHIVVHYSATYADQDIGRAEIDVMHRARGFSGIGYHYVICRNGSIELGRPENVVGAHVGGQNSRKIGICCIGGLERASGPNKGVDNRTPAQRAALAALIRDVLTRHPGAEVVGHRDLAPTQCPAFDVRAWWASANETTAPAPSIPKPQPGLQATLAALLARIFKGA